MPPRRSQPRIESVIYRPPEASSPTPDVRTSREIVAGLLGMAFLFAALIWYTADLWCGKAPWLCLDGLDGGVTMAGGNAAAHFLHTELMHRLKMRSVPELLFRFDPSIERGARLASLISDVAGPGPGS